MIAVMPNLSSDNIPNSLSKTDAPWFSNFPLIYNNIFFKLPYNGIYFSYLYFKTTLI